MAIIDMAFVWAWHCSKCGQNSVPLRHRTKPEQRATASQALIFATKHLAQCGVRPPVEPTMFSSIVGLYWGDPWR